jgi:hypothetical protein
MTQLELYKGDKPVLVNADAVLALVAYISEKRDRQAFFEAAKPYEGQLTVSAAFRKQLMDFLAANGKSATLSDPVTFEELFDAAALIESSGLKDEFLKPLNKGADIVAEPALVNLVKKFLFERLGAEPDFPERGPSKNAKVKQVVQSPPGATSCFPK